VGKLTIELGDYASAGKHGPFTVALGDDKKSKKASKDGRGSPSIKVVLALSLLSLAWRFALGVS
jgi:hypothetical protein